MSHKQAKNLRSVTVSNGDTTYELKPNQFKEMHMNTIAAKNAAGSTTESEVNVLRAALQETAVENDKLKTDLKSVINKYTTQRNNDAATIDGLTARLQTFNTETPMTNEDTQSTAYLIVAWQAAISVTKSLARAAWDGIVNATRVRSLITHAAVGAFAAFGYAAFVGWTMPIILTGFAVGAALSFAWDVAAGVFNAERRTAIKTSVSGTWSWLKGKVSSTFSKTETAAA